MADEPLIVTITITQGGAKLHEQMIPAEMSGVYEFSPDHGIDFRDGRVFYGYEFYPRIMGVEREPVDVLESPEEPLA